MITLPKFNSSPLKGYPKVRIVFQPSFFQGRTIKLQGGRLYPIPGNSLWHVWDGEFTCAEIKGWNGDLQLGDFNSWPLESPGHCVLIPNWYHSPNTITKKIGVHQRLPSRERSHIRPWEFRKISKVLGFDMLIPRRVYVLSGEFWSSKIRNYYFLRLPGISSQPSNLQHVHQKASAKHVPLGEVSPWESAFRWGDTFLSGKFGGGPGLRGCEVWSKDVQFDGLHALSIQVVMV